MLKSLIDLHPRPRGARASFAQCDRDPKRKRYKRRHRDAPSPRPYQLCSDRSSVRANRETNESHYAGAAETWKLFCLAQTGADFCEPTRGRDVRRRCQLIEEDENRWIQHSLQSRRKWSCRNALRKVRFHPQTLPLSYGSKWVESGRRCRLAFGLAKALVSP